ncbi:UxaA family hydrolase [Treponema sp. OMZ 840]|uniref:UxaA family hydrolase n=1 Tax=Treponema sp. OMZ 840 TaxID=244313 RepID=UPI003D8CAF51
MTKAIKLHDLDTVASVFEQAKAGNEILVLDKKGKSFSLKVLQDIPYGHKVAIQEHKVGEQVTKYGEEIGIASLPIKAGEHVHVHNIESIRGRGDWNIEKEQQVAATVKRSKK